MIYIVLLILAILAVVLTAFLQTRDELAGGGFRRVVHTKVPCACGWLPHGEYFRDPRCESASRLYEKRQRQTLR